MMQVAENLDEKFANLAKTSPSALYALAAERAGLETVPCWVREMSDEAAYMALALHNAQSELHVLERGLHALGIIEPNKHGRSVKAYAERVGRSGEIRNVQREIDAAEVAHEVGDIANLLPYASHLAEIHSAPEWLWCALVARMVEKNWTVEATREAVKGA